MRKYTVAKRTQKFKGTNGALRTWTSPTYYLIYYENRKKILENTKETDKEKADRWAEERIKQLEGITLADFLASNNWLSETDNPLYLYSNSKATDDYSYLYGQSKRNARYLSILYYQFKDEILKKVYTDITSDDVREFKFRLEKIETYKDAWGNQRKTTPTLFNRILDSLSTIYSYYMTKDRSVGISNNPFLKKPAGRFVINEPKEKFIFRPDLITNIFDKETLEGIIPRTTINGTDVPLTMKKWLAILDSNYFPYFQFLAYTGLRISEASALTVGQFKKQYQNRVVEIDRAFKAELTREINIEGKHIDPIGTPKNGFPRTIVLCDRAYRTVKPFLVGKKDSDYVFTSDNSDFSIKNSFITKKQEAVFRTFIDVIEDYYKIKHPDNVVLSCHAFRTSMNTNLLGKTKIKESLVAGYLGWASQALTKVQKQSYTKYTVEEMYEVANSINIMFDNKPMKWKPSVEMINSLEWQNIHDSLKKNVDKRKLTISRFYELLNRVKQIIGEDSKIDSEAISACENETEELLAMDKREFTKEIYRRYYEKYEQIILSDNSLKQLVKFIDEFWGE